MNYAEWLHTQAPIVADWRVLLEYGLGNGVVLGGQISRIDYDSVSDRYRGVLLGPVPDDWPDGLRFPLLQRAVSRLLGRNEMLLSIGIQELSGEGLADRAFDRADMDAADEDAQRLATEIARQFVALGIGGPRVP